MSKDERIGRIFRHLREVPVAEAEASATPQVIYGLAGSPTEGNNLVIAPLTGRACVYCHIAVDEWEYHAPTESDHYFITSERGHWTERFFEVQSCGEFYLNDVLIKDRQIIISTKHVEIEASLFQEISFSFGDVSQSKHYQHRFHHEELPDGVQALFQRHNFSIFVDGGKGKKHLRVREAVFHVGSVLVAAGVVAESVRNIPEHSAESMQKEVSTVSTANDSRALEADQKVEIAHDGTSISADVGDMHADKAAAVSSGGGEAEMSIDVHINDQASSSLILRPVTNHSSLYDTIIFIT
jgi:hypothetical protein